jgi:hypothetical protein
MFIFYFLRNKGFTGAREPKKKKVRLVYVGTIVFVVCCGEGCQRTVVVGCPVVPYYFDPSFFFHLREIQDL